MLTRSSRLWCFLGLVVLGSCSPSTSIESGSGNHPPTENIEEVSEDSSGHFRQAESARGTIVFMHGVLGGVPGTWTNGSSGAYWPELVANDPTFEGWNIFMHEYESPPLGHALSLDELAENLNNELAFYDVLGSEEIIFVCHSMGGLVTRAFLFKEREVAKKVRFIYFYATPTEGSEISKIAAIFSSNPQFGKMVQVSDGTSYLEDQMRNWIGRLSSIPSYCAYETKPIGVLEIVPMDSAAAMCNRRILPITENHINIVKPEDDEDHAHKALVVAFREMMPVYSVSLSRDQSIGGALRMIASMEGGQIRFISCDSGALSEKMGVDRDESSVSIEALLEEVVRDHLKVSNFEIRHDDEGGNYEILCNP